MKSSTITARGAMKLVVDRAATSELCALITAASQSIDMVSYICVAASMRSTAAYSELWREMAAAPKRGILCRAIMAAPSPDSTLAAANVIAASKLSDMGWQCVLAGGSKISHSKIWIFDNQLAMIGSHNLTESAMTRNSEISIITDSVPIVARLSEIFSLAFLKWRK